MTKMLHRVKQLRVTCARLKSWNIPSTVQHDWSETCNIGLLHRLKQVHVHSWRLGTFHPRCNMTAVKRATFSGVTWPRCCNNWKIYACTVDKLEHSIHTATWSEWSMHHCWFFWNTREIIFVTFRPNIETYRFLKHIYKIFITFKWNILICVRFFFFLSDVFTVASLGFFFLRVLFSLRETKMNAPRS